MEGVHSGLIKILDLQTAIHEEAASVRNLLPPEGFWPALTSKAEKLANSIIAQLYKGYVPTPNSYVLARKPETGSRPVALVTPLDRILYRALVNRVLIGEEPLDRSGNAYVAFVKGPYDYSISIADPELHRGFTAMAGSAFKYVVKSDVAAFYQYIDHSLLRDELFQISSEYEAIEALVGMLGELEGRAYGIPQLLDPSDRLSEVYIRRVERAMARKGYDIWRYNDDFRIGCTDYSHALRSIDDLSSAARDSGLILNDSKTFTFKYFSYAMDQLGLSLSDGVTIAPDEVEDSVGDYTDEFGLERVC